MSWDLCAMAETDKFAWITESYGGKGTAPPLSQEEHLDPCLDRLLLLFWAHYIEDDPHLLCTGSLQEVTENKGEGVANYIKKEGYLQM